MKPTMLLINVYGPYPNHLDIERKAVNRSIYHFSDLGRFCLETQIDEQDEWTTVDIYNNWTLIRIQSQLNYYEGKLYPLSGWVKESIKTYNYPDESYKDKNKSILSIATEYINIPYRWGGRSKYMTDCSGLIYQIYREKGIILPRYANGQF